MIKTLFNTKTFDHLLTDSPLQVVTSPDQAQLLVMGAKKVDYTQFPNLAAVYRFGVGAENIDFAYLDNRGIKIVFPSEKAKKILYDATANFTAYGILSRFFDGAFGNVDLWEKTERSYVGDKTALVVGLGNVGRRVAEKLKPFMRVLTYDLLDGVPQGLDQLIPCADVITVHVPSTPETRGLLGSKLLSLAKDDVLLINTARGDVYDENALFEKLKTSNSRAFFDVFWQEPYDGRLKELGVDKFFMTPHSASNTKEFVDEGFRDILNLAADMKGSHV